MVDVNEDDPDEERAALLLLFEGESELTSVRLLAPANAGGIVVTIRRAGAAGPFTWAAGPAGGDPAGWSDGRSYSTAAAAHAAAMRAVATARQREPAGPAKPTSDDTRNSH